MDINFIAQFWTFVDTLTLQKDHKNLGWSPKLHYMRGLNFIRQLFGSLGGQIPQHMKMQLLAPYLGLAAVISKYKLVHVQTSS